MPSKKHPVTHTVTAEHNGTMHSADYTVENGVVIVRYCMATNQAIATHPSLHQHEAKRLFCEILTAGKWKF